MNEHTLRVLEYHELLEVLASYACSESGRARVRAFRPAIQPEAWQAERALHAALLDVRRQGVHPPTARFDSPADILRRAAPERTTLEPADFVAVRAFLATLNSVCAFLRGAPGAGSATLQAFAAKAANGSGLGRSIDAVIDPRNGQVRDEASDRLRDIRNRMAVLDRRIHRHLEDMLQKTALGDVFQEQFITLRQGRYVVPVRRDAHAALKGILHDQSNSGETLFIEPEAVVEAGNELEQTRLDERDEIRRILLALSDELRGYSADIRNNSEWLTTYDAAFAVSAWALDYGCSFPAVGGELRLSQARHPLLCHHFRAENRENDLVPLDLDLPAGRSVVVITGSNTGGKTVVLKTVGLLTLMAQTGLPVPAAEPTRIRCFPGVVADIGDEQSIEQNLSTFSGHVRHIVDILTSAAARESLVLIDELGSGTDPAEGAALGCAILDVLSRAAGLTLATTHLGVVKTFVYEHPMMENASMAFDVQTLRPAYRVEVGRAGASYALTIAERCGIPKAVIEDARRLMSAEQRRLEEVLRELDEKHLLLRQELQATHQASGDAARARDEAARERDKIVSELKALRTERRRLLHRAQDEAAALVVNARREVERIVSAARGQPDRETARGLRRQLDDRAGRLKQGLEETQSRPDGDLGREELAVGARVWVEAMNAHGRLLALSGDGRRATLEVGGLSVEVDRARLSRPRTAEPHRSTEPAVTRRLAPRRRAAEELNVVGQRVEQAVAAVERFIDDALLAGLTEVRIVHGYGTGALRQAIHARLDRGPARGYRLGRDEDETGGSGVTHVTL